MCPADGARHGPAAGRHRAQRIRMRTAKALAKGGSHGIVHHLLSDRADRDLQRWPSGGRSERLAQGAGEL